MTKRHQRQADGLYHIGPKGHKKKYKVLTGKRAQVWHGTAYQTSGGLTKGDLLKNKHGRIVSKKKHKTAKKENRLVKAGYGTKKGHFGAVKIKPSHSTRKRRKSSKKRKGRKRDSHGRYSRGGRR